MPRVAVALSGGVDSSVTALILKQQGYDVIGVTAKTTNTKEAEQVLLNAEAVANKLEIPFYGLNVTKVFEEKVIKYFENSYKNGETPNPCIMCNKYIKWGMLFDYSITELNADFIATGHYAKIRKSDDFYKLFPASDEHKDQLYFLFLLNQTQLKRTIFPLSELQKNQVKQIAFDNDLPSKSSKESQDICFIQTPMTTKKYLIEKLGNNANGKFIEQCSEKVLGTHNGYWQYTVGQRKGIGIAAPEPLYVTDIDAPTNTVYVGYKNELLKSSLNLKYMNWSYPQNNNKFKALVKIRYNMKAIPANIEVIENSVNIHFDIPVSGIAKGQACVLYDINDGHLIGGAFI